MKSSKSERSIKQLLQTSFRCSVCGKFLPYNDDSVIGEYIPDNAFGGEELNFNHRKCSNK